VLFVENSPRTFLEITFRLLTGNENRIECPYRMTDPNPLQQESQDSPSEHKRLKDMSININRRNFLKYSVVAGLAVSPFLVRYWRNSRTRNIMNQTFAIEKIDYLSPPWITALSPLMRSCLSPDGRVIAVSGGQFWGKQMIFSAEMDAVLKHSEILKHSDEDTSVDDTNLFVPIISKLHPSYVLALALSSGPEYRLACVIREVEGVTQSVSDFSDENEYIRYISGQQCVDRLYVLSLKQKEPLVSLVCRNNISGTLLFDISENYQISWNGADRLFFYNDHEIQLVSVSGNIKTVYSSRNKRHVYSNILCSESTDKICFIEIPRDAVEDEYVKVCLTSCSANDGSSLVQAGSLNIHNRSSVLLTKDRFHYFLPTLDGSANCHYSVSLDKLSGDGWAAHQQICNPFLIKNDLDVPLFLVPQAYLPSQNAILCMACLGNPNDLGEILRIAELNEGLVCTLALVYCS